MQHTSRAGGLPLRPALAFASFVHTVPLPFRSTATTPNDCPEHVLNVTRGFQTSTQARPSSGCSRTPHSNPSRGRIHDSSPLLTRCSRRHGGFAQLLRFAGPSKCGVKNGLFWQWRLTDRGPAFGGRKLPGLFRTKTPTIPR